MAQSDNSDQRPAVWIGHVILATRELSATSDFLAQLGMRSLERLDEVSIFELRGGTHLVLLQSDDAQAGLAEFDLMVDDVDATRARFQQLGIEMSKLEEDKIHRSFTVT